MANLKKIVIAACAVIALATVIAAPELQAPTYDSVPYGAHPKQRIDVYLPKDATTPTPVIIYIHGGGFSLGDRKDKVCVANFPMYKKAGVAIVSVDYRYLKEVGDVKPPVRGCMDDIFAAICFVRSKAKDWNLDLSRLGLAGGSAGAHSALCAALTDNNAFDVRVVHAHRPQTTMDPEEMASWVPNARYGHRLFGFDSFAEWRAHRAECKPWTEKYSPMVLIGKCAVGKVPTIILSGRNPPKSGETETDPTHSGTYIEKFLARTRQLGINCRRGTCDDFIKELKK